MDVKYILSLVMPTFNRKQEIQVSIKTLLDTLPIEKFRNRLELLILDNDSNYDIESILEDIIAVANVKLTIRIIKNTENIGNDRNFLKGICEAKGKYILQCSDRYYYNINFTNLLHMLENDNPECVIFSNLFRKYTRTEITLNNSYMDDWFSEEFDLIKKDKTFFQLDKKALIDSHYIKSGLINSFSDLIFRNMGEAYFNRKLGYFLNSHMLGVAAQLDSVSISEKINIFRVSYANQTHQNIGRANLYNRHNYNEVYYGNIELQKKYNFIGSSNEVKLLQIRGLINLYLKDKAGIYYAEIKPDKVLINESISTHSLKMKLHEKLDLFFVNHTPPTIILKNYLLMKKLYICTQKEYRKIRNDLEKVSFLRKEIY